jgi:hypothetical protein
VIFLVFPGHCEAEGGEPVAGALPLAGIALFLSFLGLTHSIEEWRRRGYEIVLGWDCQAELVMTGRHVPESLRVVEDHIGKPESPPRVAVERNLANLDLSNRRLHGPIRRDV